MTAIFHHTALIHATAMTALLAITLMLGRLAACPVPARHRWQSFGGATNRPRRQTFW
jgi:hypothetical protein